MNPAPAVCERRAGRIWLVYAAAHADLVAALGLDDVDGVRDLLRVSDAERAASPPVAGRAPTRRIALGGTTLHLRRARHGGLLAPLWRGGMAGVGRMRAEFEATLALHARRAPVPEPVFGLGWRRGLLWEVGLATLHETDARDGLAFLASRPEPARIVAAARAAGLAVRAFHDAGARHADLNLGNLLLREGPSGPEARVIDLDRVAYPAPPSAARRRRELRRLDRSLAHSGYADRVPAEARGAFRDAYRYGSGEASGSDAGAGTPSTLR